MYFSFFKVATFWEIPFTLFRLEPSEQYIQTIAVFYFLLPSIC